MLTKLQETKMNENEDRVGSPESYCGSEYIHEDVRTQSVSTSTVASQLTSLLV